MIPYVNSTCARLKKAPAGPAEASGGVAKIRPSGQPGPVHFALKQLDILMTAKGILD